MALVLSGSVMILKILISFMCRERRHIYEDQIQDCLVKFAKRLKCLFRGVVCL